MEGNASLWVLDFLLEADGLDDTLIKHFHDVNASQFEELPANTQARLMLRVLRDAPSQISGISEAALGALNMLRNLASQASDASVHTANLQAVRPPDDLFAEVKTELVLKGLREGSQTEEHPTAIMDRFFQLNDESSSSVLNPFEMARRNELAEGLKGQEEAQQLLNKYSAARVNELLLTFVASARTALGPNLLRLVERDVQEGSYNPYALRNQQGVKRRRTKGNTSGSEEGATALLGNISHGPAALAGAGAEEILNGVRMAAQQEREGSEGGLQRPGQSGNPGDSTAGVSTGTENSAGRTTKTGQVIRRRNGRWNEEETNFLIQKVRERGKGKWKNILELGGPIFQNRSQVDLKDKWRNLERQGVVGPQDLPAQPLQPISGQIQMGIPHPVGQPQLTSDGQILGTPFLTGANGEPLTDPHLYSHFAQLTGQQLNPHQIPPEMMQQLAQMPAHSFQQMAGQIVQSADHHAHQQDIQPPQSQEPSNQIQEPVQLQGAAAEPIDGHAVEGNGDTLKHRGAHQVQEHHENAMHDNQAVLQQESQKPLKVETAQE